MTSTTITSAGDAGAPVRDALRASIPVLLGYVPLGIVFGFLFVQAGGAPWLAVVSSILIYGGAVQYMMVPMLAAGASVASIAFATAVLNLRHIFYGLPLLRKMPESGWRRWYCVFALTDETFSLLSLLPEDAPKTKVFWLSFFNHLWWVTGSALGAVIGAAAKIDLAGMDFVLTSLFAMLMCELWRQRTSAWPLWSALAGYFAARLLLPEHALSVSIAFCMAAGLLWGRLRRRHSCSAGEEKTRQKEPAAADASEARASQDNGSGSRLTSREVP